MMYNLLFDVVGKVATITVNRSEVRNAINDAMLVTWADSGYSVN